MVDESIKEEVRLSVTVKDITNEAMIIPKGASSDYSKSSHFNGLSPRDSRDLKNWSGQGVMHEKYWSVQSHVNRLGSDSQYTMLSSLLWIGAMAVAVPNSNIYSKIYLGNGERNLDLMHML